MFKSNSWRPVTSLIFFSSLLHASKQIQNEINDINISNESKTNLSLEMILARNHRPAEAYK